MATAAANMQLATGVQPGQELIYYHLASISHERRKLDLCSPKIREFAGSISSSSWLTCSIVCFASGPN